MIRGRLADRAYHDTQKAKGVQGKKRVAYIWEVVAVPGEEHQAFLGRLFRWTDLEFGEWPPGFRFRNIHTGEEIHF